MEDKQLERIYDYTKFHIGIYLSTAGALTAATSYLSESTKAGELAKYVGSPKLFVLAVVLMFLAGVAGAIVASSCTECETYEELWYCKHGPYGLRLLPGRLWAAAEHSFFWLSAISIILSVASADPFLKWVTQ